MLRWFFTGFLALVLMSGCSADDGPALPELAGQYRVIASFTDSAERAESLANAFKSAPGFDERDIAWFVVSPDGIRSNLSDVPPRERLEQIHTVEGFQTVLIGKDGTLKASQLGGLDIQALLEAIDAMPMRQAEMNR
ncbi:DUF4174 domain-containing protein [uncultured Salinisphaera sp.]|uniref:DUF4174 domain-containing protein n=1 Tax=uncultured Salinisphaera sp. TaxID=359372 RepID=UPI0032B1FFBF|tara:strand:+ start:215 stop:625 length:411 start_codon:yes stop_codon:yes gene_type:complete